MKKLLMFLLAGLFSVSLVQADPVSTVWEKAALGTNPAYTQVFLRGINPAITSTYEAVWQEGEAYAPLSVAMSTPYCASTSANDAAAGTGARTITVTGIDTSFASFSEVVTMNGVSSVNLATANVLLINSLEVTTAGSGALNAGVIACGTGANTAGDPAVVHAYLPASSATAIQNLGLGGGNKSTAFIYGVKANYTLLCRNFNVGSTFATAASSIAVAIDTYTNLGLLKRAFEWAVHSSGANPAILPGVLKFPEKTIIVGKAAGAAGTLTGPVSMSAECILINNDYLNQAGSVF